jgi:hypothetical protein
MQLIVCASWRVAVWVNRMVFGPFVSFARVSVAGLACCVGDGHHLGICVFLFLFDFCREMIGNASQLDLISDKITR